MHLALLIGLLLCASESWSQDTNYASQISIKSQYLGKLGTIVDDRVVLQPYLEINHDSGWYGNLWINIPLSDGNPNRSMEIEPTAGYRYELGDWKWNWSLTLFDIQNPGLLDFSGDVLGPRLMLSRSNWYLEALHYEADGAENGSLFGSGVNWQLDRGFEIQASLNYVDGPFHYEPIVYGKVKVIWSSPTYGVDLFVELLDIVQEQNLGESRRDQIAVGLNFKR